MKTSKPENEDDFMKKYLVGEALTGEPTIKTFEPDDPMELVGVALPQENVDYMAECLVEEYVLLGWSDKQLMALFSNPMFQATHHIYQDKGEEYVRSLIQKVRDKWSQGWIRTGETDA